MELNKIRSDGGISASLALLYPKPVLHHPQRKRELRWTHSEALG